MNPRRHIVVAVTITAIALAGCSGDQAPEPSASGVATSASGGASDGATAPSSDPTASTASVAATTSDAPPPSSSPSTAVPEDLDPLQGLAFEVVTDGLSQPIDVVTRPDDGSVWVVQQGGEVVGVQSDGSVSSSLLDVAPVMELHSIEQGLLGMAFHPDYPRDLRIFAFHSLPSNDNVLASWQVDQATQQADPATRVDLLVVDKEPDKVRHNGGKILFGPDGLLYLSLGDAARASVNGQDPTTLPGTVVRIDVDRTGDDGTPYAIPDGNPFADGATVQGVAGAPEVWWFGLRNPWRFSIDGSTGMAWIGDVGQDSVEEVNVAPLDQPGLNFGWPALEGTGTFYDDPPVTDTVAPILEVAHDDQAQGCSITGGVVHRGAAIPELNGTYFYADWCNGWIRSLEWDGQTVTAQDDWSEDLPAGMVAAFGLDADGEVLVLDWEAGTLSRIVPVR